MFLSCILLCSAHGAKINNSSGLYWSVQTCRNYVWLFVTCTRLLLILGTSFVNMSFDILHSCMCPHLSIKLSLTTCLFKSANSNSNFIPRRIQDTSWHFLQRASSCWQNSSQTADLTLADNEVSRVWDLNLKSCNLTKKNQMLTNVVVLEVESCNLNLLVSRFIHILNSCPNKIILNSIGIATHRFNSWSDLVLLANSHQHQATRHAKLYINTSRPIT